MTDAEWEAQATSEKQAFERFHALKKSNSSRRERQEAWRVTQAILDRRRDRSRRTHPIAPSDRYWDFMNEAPDGWTYPTWRSLEPDEVDELAPGARASFENQGIDRYRFVYEHYDHKLRVSVPNIGGGYRRTCMTWLPEMGIWRRYHRAVKSRPYRSLDESANAVEGMQSAIRTLRAAITFVKETT